MFTQSIWLYSSKPNR